jgi:prepilin-type N-terminal cleavage/methylation domain-containing protein
MRNSTHQSGFSAVELMISLFIAAAFISAGYQLYAAIIKDGAEARFRARASNIAYTNLRLYAAQVTNPCTIVTPTPTPTLDSTSGLSNPSITVTYSCPYGAASSITQVQVSVKYGSPQQEVIHALLTND